MTAYVDMAPVAVAGVALDGFLGEPPRLHPLVGFGRLARTLDRRIHADSRWRGAFATLLLIVPFTALSYAGGRVFGGGPMALVLVYLALGCRSLHQHAGRVRAALLQGDLPRARRQLGRMVSRKTRALDECAIARATIESVLENGNDAVFGTIFWLAVAGAPGIVLHRLVNTLDAMWGYRDARYDSFGWSAARLDDLLNYVPARLAALTYALLGRTGTALRCWHRQARAWDSPNAGPVLAAGAGSLGLLLGGPATYGEVVRTRSMLGEGPPPRPEDIGRALGLVRRTLGLWLVLLLVVAWGLQ